MDRPRGRQEASGPATVEAVVRALLLVVLALFALWIVFTVIGWVVKGLLFAAVAAAVVAGGVALVRRR